MNSLGGINMAYVIQIDFKMDGPFGEEMAEEFAGLAESINEEEGFLSLIHI